MLQVVPSIHVHLIASGAGWPSADLGVGLSSTKRHEKPGVFCCVIMVIVTFQFLIRPKKKRPAYNKRQCGGCSLIKTQPPAWNSIVLPCLFNCAHLNCFCLSLEETAFQFNQQLISLLS